MTPADMALIEAVRVRSVEAARTALAAGAYVNVADPRPLIGSHNTPLHYAADNGNRELVELLLAHGADVNARCERGWTPLLRACNASNLRVAALLLSSGADPYIANDEGYIAADRVAICEPELIALMRPYARSVTPG